MRQKVRVKINNPRKKGKNDDNKSMKSMNKSMKSRGSESSGKSGKSLSQKKKLGLNKNRKVEQKVEVIEIQKVIGGVIEEGEGEDEED